MTTLDFAFLDDLAVASELRGLDATVYLSDLALGDIGPLVELLLLSRMPTLSTLSIDKLPMSRRRKALGDALLPANSGRGVYIASGERRAGFIATSRNPYDSEATEWTQFCVNAQAAAELSGLSKETAQAMIGALREIEENIHAHSTRAVDGIVGFSAERNGFEFVLGDNGIGALRSLRQHPDYMTLEDAGTALQLALTDGQSRYGRASGHGWGFHALFVGLANLRGTLRFRTDDHALIIDGDSPSLITARLVQRATLQGFFANVICRPHFGGGSAG